MDISLVIPLYNEEESLTELEAWIRKVMQENGYSYEIVFVDDGSTDASWEVVQKLNRTNPNVRGIRFRRNYGKSAGLNVGFSHAKGDVVITMDADLQDNPEEVPELYDMIAKEDYDLVSGWKKKRYDPISKTIPTKLFNWTTRRMSGIYLHDFNCGLKAYSSEVIKNIEVYGEMHRYIPVIAKWAGFKKIGEKPVRHQARKYGTTKFGVERFVNGVLDLMTIIFISRFGKRPMHFFGLIGIFTFIVGGVITLWLIIEKLIKLNQPVRPRDVVDQPLFYLALSAIIIGVQLFLTGFVAEMISRSSHDRNSYQVREEV